MTAQTQEASDMAFNALEQTHQRLSSNPDITDHNKQVLNEFFLKARSGGVNAATLRDFDFSSSTTAQ
ncbi:MAG: hypothetical protein SV186_02215 [Candidatus Nanohaloarchaea archaeon]|nr:hypothetical protein [Candidatus Nanohaloarchaea archaeon]